MDENQILIDPSKVYDIADRLETQNNKLKNELEETFQIMMELGKYYDAESYRLSKAAFQSFVDEYSTSYEQVVKGYITYLRERVAKGIIDTESMNSDMENAFK